MLVAAAAAAVAVPAAGAGVMPGTYVQIDGKLVNAEHLSAYEAQAGSPRSGHLVQIGGKLVRPDQVSAYQVEMSQAAPATQASSEDDGFGWTSTGIEVGVLTSLLLAAGTLAVL